MIRIWSLQKYRSLVWDMGKFKNHMQLISGSEDLLLLFSFEHVSGLRPVFILGDGCCSDVVSHI